MGKYFYTGGMRVALLALLCSVMLILPSGSGTISAVSDPTAPLHSDVPLSSEDTPATEDPDDLNDTPENAEDEPVNPPVFSVSVIPSAPTLEPTGEESGEYLFHVRLEHVGEDLLPAGQIHVHLLTDPITAPAHLSAPNMFTRVTSTEIAEINTPELAQGEVYETELTLASPDFPLTILSTPGVYLTGVQWEANGQFLASAPPVIEPSTPFVWNTDEFRGSLDLASIIPIVYPAGETPPLTPGEVEAELGGGRFAERLLQTAETAQSLVAVDPRIIAYVRSLGANASSDSRELVDALTSPELRSFALQYADTDVAVTAQLPREISLDPAGISFLTRHFTSLTEQVESDFAHPRVNDEVPSLTDGSVPPPMDQIVSWEAALEGFVWPSRSSVDEQLLTQLDARGLSQVVVSGEDAEGAAKGMIGATTVYHSELSLERAASDLLLADTELDEARALTQLTSITTLLSTLGTDEIPSQSLLAVDRGLTSTAESLDPLFAELGELPWVNLIPTSELQLGTVTLTGNPATEPAVDRLRDAINAETEVQQYSRVLADPQLLTDYQRERLLTLLRVQGSLSASEVDVMAVDERVYDHLAGNAELRAGVSIVDTEHTRLLGSTSNIPIQLRNTLPFDAEVTGTITTSSAALLVSNTTLVPTVIPPESTVTHLVTVNSRVSSGEVDLRVNLRDIHEGHDIAHTSFHVTLSGTTEVIALTALGLVVSALFVGGVWRSLLKKRRRV